MSETIVTSIRVPTERHRQAKALEHPGGFNGVLNDALALYLAPTDDTETRRKLDLLRRALLGELE